jgi:hypothetical protein
MKTEIILLYNRNASVPFAVVDADWVSRSVGTGRTEFFKKGKLVDTLTLGRSQYIFVAPVSDPPSSFSA